MAPGPGNAGPGNAGPGKAGLVARINALKHGRLIATAVVAVAALAVLVLIASLLRTLPAIQDFIRSYPGQPALPSWAPIGIPVWLNVQHYLNLFFMVLLVKAGLAVRNTRRPPAYWTRNNSGLIRTKRPPKKVSIDLWWHITVDALWFANGVVFVVLLFATGQWARIVPTSWSVVPNALSAALQYLSLNWPHESAWTGYNGLQMLAYAGVVFVLAPLSALTGLRMSSVWNPDWKLSKRFPIEAARAVHYPTMFAFVLFVIVHVFLVLTTGALSNLNAMFASNAGDGWLGFVLFAVGIVVVVAAWFAARPVLLSPIARLSGKVTRQ